MLVESRPISRIEQELLFNQWCKRRDISLFLFDGDDTVWGTVEIFRRHLSSCYDFLETNYPIITRDQWQAGIQKINDDMYETHGVNPTRWKHVMDQAAVETGLSSDVKDQVTEKLMQIYQTPPIFLDGAQDGLAFVKRTGIPFGVVTHANHDWTLDKFHWLGLDKYFNWEDVFIVDEDGHKTAESWQQAFKYFGVRPENCAVVGDSPRSDINPAYEAGVRTLFLVNGKESRWPIHDQPVPDITIRISGLNDLINLARYPEN